MREELTEPRHWRSHTAAGATEVTGWNIAGLAAKKSAGQSAQLEPTVVDAAFEQEAVSAAAVRGSRRETSAGRESRSAAQLLASSERKPALPSVQLTEEIIQRISSQLEQIDAQRRQLSQLLSEAQQAPQ